MSHETILLIEDQKSMAMLLQSYLSKHCDNPIICVHTLADAREALRTEPSIEVCLTDLTLPDSNQYEVVDLLRQYKVTTVVFTGAYSEAVRQKVFDAHVADYVIKDGQASIEYAITSIKSLIDNPSKHIWIISDHLKFIQRTQGLLKIQRYQVRVFEDYHSVTKALESGYPDLMLVDQLAVEKKVGIYDIIRDVRSEYSDSELPMIGIEYSHKLNDSIKLMKYGVGELLSVEYLTEELYLRVRKNIEQSQAYKVLKDISQKDGLSKLYNRRYFFEVAEPKFEDFLKHKTNFFLVMVDIDHFKQVNDRYGHQVGDEAIAFTARYLQSVFSDHLVARFGGEEFIVFGECDDRQQVIDLCENFRLSIETQSDASIDVAFTVSQGITFSAKALNEAISIADQHLYQAKQRGRNLVVY